MPGQGPQFERRLAAIFQAEAAEHVQRMRACVTRLEGADGREQHDTLALLFRATHSLKGAARAVGRDAVETLCHAMESVLAALQKGRLEWSIALGKVLHDAVAILERALLGGGVQPGELAALLPALERLESGAPVQAAAPAESEKLIDPPPAPAGADSALTQTVRVDVERLGKLLYQVEELVYVKLGAQQLTREVDEAVASGLALRAGAAAGAHREHAARLRGLKVAAVSEQRHLESAVGALLASVKATLLQPVALLRPFLFATVRELSRSLGKEVEFRLQGDEVEMDRRLLEQLREPLVHLMRNAIAHGIEMPGERTALGKPVRARLDVTVRSKAGGRAVVDVSDDGAGVDTVKLAQAARALGMPLPEQPSEAQLLALVFGHGVSTAVRLTEVAGRGVGLAIARETVERLGGSIAVASTPGQGTTFTMVLPLSLATFRAIEVRVGQRSYLIPTSQVERCVRYAAHQLQLVRGRHVVPFGPESLPLVGLDSLLGTQGGTTARISRWHCLVLRSGDARVAVAVDELLGEQEVLSKPVEPGLTEIPLVMGAAALGAGRTVPILNGAELARAAWREAERGQSGTSAHAASGTSRRTILLAEDSITSRALLKNILEVAGYRVEVAVDGAQALQKLRAGRYDLLVSDIDMPQLDGIGLTRAIRNDDALAQLPIVLVTSLGSPTDRARGAEAGASAYIVKSNFDQGNLLKAIEELL